MIQWSSAMETGVPVIDRQHKELVRQVNELVEAMRAGKGRQVVGDTLVFLGRYAQEHFETEEGLMKRFGYPGYERHRAVHEAFKRDFADLSAEYDRNPEKLALTIKVQKRVMDWLREHILRVDAEAGRYLREHGAV